MEISLFLFFLNLEDDDSVTSFLSRKLFKYYLKKKQTQIKQPKTETKKNQQNKTLVHIE